MKHTKPRVLFETEGSYPFHGGGVSTWSHILCGELENEVDFILLALVGTPFLESRYQRLSNIKQIIRIPMWGAEEPAEYYNQTIPFSKHIERKHATTQQVVQQYFYPVFKDFIDCVLFNPFQPAGIFGEILYGFWKFYQHFDYKQTLSNPLLWIEFKHRLNERFKDEEVLSEEMPCVFDVTFGMRWLYHFMMPLAVPVPRVDLTHATLAGFPAITSIVAKYEYGIPLLLTDHGVYIRERLINIGQSEFPFFSKKLLVNLTTFMTRAVYHHADLIAPVTSINKKWETEYEGAEERIQAFYNGVDTDIFRPAAKPAKTAGTPTVVAAAQIFPLKDIETMIWSCHFVRQEIPGVQYILYGSLEVDPPYTEKCKKLVRELKLENHFTFGGFHNTPSMIFNEGDLSVLSSISEGFPYTVIESMSCGRPVVSTDVGGIREALEGCGILCKPRNAKALAEGVINLLNNDEMRLEMGRKARDRVLLKYTTQQSVARYHQVYQQFSRQPATPLKHQLTLPSVVKLINYIEKKYG